MYDFVITVSIAVLFMQKGITSAVETCPKSHGPEVMSRSSADGTELTLMNIGNPITCNGYIRGWRFIPTQSDTLVAMIFREQSSKKTPYLIASRTHVPIKGPLNSIHEHILSKSDWIPVFTGDVVGFHHKNGLLHYDEVDDSTPTSEYLSETTNIQVKLGSLDFDSSSLWRVYSFQTLLEDLETPHFPVFNHVLQQTTKTIKNNVIYMNDWARFRSAGTIRGWRFIVAGAGDIIAYVFRAIDMTAGTHEVIGKTTITVTLDQKNMNVEHVLGESEQIPILAGDRVGYASTTGSVLYQIFNAKPISADSMYVKSSKSMPVDVNIGSIVEFISYSVRVISIEPITADYDTFKSTEVDQDYQLQNNVIATLSERSSTSCVLNCIDNHLCQSINYNAQEMSCELNDATKISDSGNFVSDVRHTYYEMNIKTKRSFSQCNIVDCGKGKVCEPSDNSNGYVCRCILTGYVDKYCPTDECSSSLGMESGSILDGQITASSIHSGDALAHCGRLNLPTENGCFGGWSAEAPFQNEWLKIDLLVEHTLTGVVSQGADYSGFSEWVELYTVSYFKVDQVGEMYITDGNGKIKIFDGNLDKNGHRLNYFQQPIQTTAIKFNMIKWNNHVSFRGELIGCREGNPWVRIFKGISMNGFSIYDAWTSGTGASSYHAHKYLISDTHYRNDVILNNWSSFDILKVKLTLYSQFNVEVKSMLFNGVGSTMTSWFASVNVEESSWDDLPAESTNYFSINGDSRNSRRFYINHGYGGCENDRGWLLITERARIGCYEGYDATPKILYSQSRSYENWSEGDVGTARAMTIDVKLG
ncbi:uncharacterized protein [Antedon mediterranea]|uniref:uncharacterized protein n=1 Tax=Antedon mediterranea TaxID=105859 RepID=UPI003AF75CEE